MPSTKSPKEKLASYKRMGFFAPLDANKTIKLLETPEELRAAYSLVYDIYLKEGYIAPNPLKIRARKFELSEHIRTFGCFHENSIIGVLSVIKDSSNGLPADFAFGAELRRLRATGDIVEISNQVIFDKYRKTPVLMSLIQSAWKYCIISGVRKAIIQIGRESLPFFSMLGFEIVSEERSSSNELTDMVIMAVIDFEKYCAAPPVDETELFFYKFANCLDTTEPLV